MSRRGSSTPHNPGRRGLIVAVVGPDGSGKSSLIEGLLARFTDSLFTGCRCFRRTLGTLPTHRSLKGRLALRIGSGSRAAGAEEPSSRHPAMLPVQPRWRSLAYPAYLAVDMWLGKRRLEGYRTAGELILFDRYFHDCFFQRGNAKAPHQALSVLERLVPRPDLILSVERDPASIYADRADLTRTEIARQQQVIRGLAASRPHMHLIDGRGGAEPTIASAARLIESVRA